jgi:hypothetical protein
MIRPQTKIADLLILKMLNMDLTPKAVARHLGLKNVWRVYNTIRRMKSICKK